MGKYVILFSADFVSKDVKHCNSNKYCNRNKFLFSWCNHLYCISSVVTEAGHGLVGQIITSAGTRKWIFLLLKWKEKLILCLSYDLCNVWMNTFDFVCIF